MAGKSLNDRVNEGVQAALGSLQLQVIALTAQVADLMERMPPAQPPAGPPAPMGES
jgi:hypothetical protein